MNRLSGMIGAAALMAAASAANAGIMFSNVNLSPEWADHIEVVTSDQDIDFFFDSDVSIIDGQPQAVIRIGITYEAWGMNMDITQDTLVVSVLGGLLGSGTMIFNEVIEDLEATSADQVTLVDYGVTLTADDDLPHVAQLMFARPAQHIKVKKTITLLAPDLNEGIDLAAISLVEQRLIPTPGVMALMGLGGLVASRRRR